jgi:hypothetical protein
MKGKSHKRKVTMTQYFFTIYYIDYNHVLCYPNTWGGCSSCSPGRYCEAEQRCILEESGGLLPDGTEQDYPCAKWY